MSVSADLFNDMFYYENLQSKYTVTPLVSLNITLTLSLTDAMSLMLI